ncbi:TolC family protein [Deinococcus sonorensis]|uniref:TolC family protein n=2 Tax=Deinococcus sonorensis TaxID=309891 RepID=A0AAU7UE17_9DEIO
MKRLVLLAPLLLGAALAQTTTPPNLTLQSAVQSALTVGSTVRDAQAGVTSAAATLKAVQADPSSLAGDLLSAQQADALARAQLAQARLVAVQSAINAYTTVYQNQEQLKVDALQVQVNQKALQVAQVKLSTRAGTALDVKTAQNTLASSQQTLSDDRKALGVNTTKLANAIGRTGSFVVAVPPTPPAVKSGAALASGYPTLLSAQQAVETAALNVKLADNEFTARVTLNDARTRLSNAQSQLSSTQKDIQTTLATALRSAQNAQAGLQTAIQAEANAQASTSQDAVRLKSGTISAVQYQQSQLALQKAHFARAQALVSLWQALATLSVNSGEDNTGFVASTAPAASR